MTTRDNPLRWGEGAIEERTRNGRTTYLARWLAPAPDGTAKRHSKSFAAREDAEDHLRRIYRDKRAGRYAAPSTLTVADLVMEHIDRSLAAGRITEGTALTYRYRAKAYLRGLGPKRVVAVVPLDVQRWLDQLIRAHLAPSTIGTISAVVSGAFREATLLGIIDRNPTIGVRRPTVVPPDAAAWTADEARAVLAATRDHRLGVFYATALTTGMRPGELRALTWSDVDLDAATVTVRRTMARDEANRQIVGATTKGKRSRVIRIPAALVALLRRHKVAQTERRLRHEAWHHHDLVLDRGDGMWWHERTIAYIHEDVCAMTGVTPIRLHDLRHTAATLLVERGIHPKVVADMLGHAHIAVTMDRYTHLTPHHQEGAASALGEALFATDERDAAEG